MSERGELIYKGAEGNLYRTVDGVLKERVSKKYRIQQLDIHLRKTRTRHEVKILEKLHEAGLAVPKVIKSSERDFMILLSDIKGSTLKDVLESSSGGEAIKHARKIGEIIRKTHDLDVVHNDLTTSNMLYDGKSVYLIDWGLGYHTSRLEDKAMDLVVFRKSLRATHPKKFEIVWAAIQEGYGGGKEVFSRVEDIEKRVRYA